MLELKAPVTNHWEELPLQRQGCGGGAGLAVHEDDPVLGAAGPVSGKNSGSGLTGAAARACLTQTWGGPRYWVSG